MKSARSEIGFPVPGHGYDIRERLGSGAWKVAYRASSLNSLSDRAVLYFHDGTDQKEMIKDITALMRTHSEHRFRHYLANVFGFFYDAEGKLFIVEELLSRPLDRAGRIRDHMTFIRIARDLCRGLIAIHESNLVHRDLKLDNCGLDHSGRAKIFDLGSVTSESGGLRGTILTRAPELLAGENSREVRFQRSADIWAMGATLFALRTGVYPFVTNEEALSRKALNEKFKLGKITKEECDAEKYKIDSKIVARGCEQDAEKKLFLRVESEFRGETLDIMKSMLRFDPKSRPVALDVESRWNERASDSNSGTKVVGSETGSGNKNLIQFLQSAARGDIEITPKMRDSVIDDYERGVFSFVEGEKEEFLKNIDLLKS